MEWEVSNSELQPTLYSVNDLLYYLRTMYVILIPCMNSSASVVVSVLVGVLFQWQVWNGGRVKWLYCCEYD